LQNRAFVQILPENFREVLKSLTPKAFGIDQNPWFFKVLWRIKFAGPFISERAFLNSRNSNTGEKSSPKILKSPSPRGE